MCENRKSQFIKIKLWVGLPNKIQDARLNSNLNNLNTLFIQINNEYFFSVSLSHVMFGNTNSELSELLGQKE